MMPRVFDVTLPPSYSEFVEHVKNVGGIDIMGVMPCKTFHTEMLVLGFAPIALVFAVFALGTIINAVISK